MRRRDVSIAAIEVVAAGLAMARQPAAFVGGATAALYVDTPGTPELRPTDDVDCVVEVTPVQMAQLCHRLNRVGFVPHPELICRYSWQGITVDIMPTDPRVLGFSNRWYKQAMAALTPYTLPGGRQVALFSFCYFVASKFEAFWARGAQDWVTSTDLEDIVAVLDGRSTALQDIFAAGLPLKAFVRDSMRRLCRRPERWREAMAGHMAGYPSPVYEQRLARLQSLCETLSCPGDLQQLHSACP